MTTWKPPHQTARQKYAAQDPTTRKLNRAAQLAPAVPLPATTCGRCEHPELIHRDGQRCLRIGCDCPWYIRPADD